MKSLLFTAFTFLLLASLTCGTAVNEGGNGKGILITGELSNARTDTMRLFQWDGVEPQIISSVPIKVKKGVGSFKFKGLNLPVGIYFVGIKSPALKQLILGEENLIALNGDFNDIPKLSTIDSPMNDEFEKLMQDVSAQQQEFQGLIGQVRRVANNPQQKIELDKKFKAVDDKRLALYESAKAKHPFFGHVASLYTYLSFQNNQGAYKDEISYFINEFMAKANVKDASFDYIPALVESMKGYVNTISRVGLDHLKQQEHIDAVFTDIPENTNRHRSLLLGTVLGYQAGKGEDNLIHYGEKFLTLYGDRYPPLQNSLTAQISKAKNMRIGGEAPEIAEKSPEGEVVKLSDFRGKYVLIDFWASWCGPCRKENPNVVKVYNKYKSKGFEILGVSLDNSKDRWVSAIEKDQLTWQHVSDLKKWGSPIAKSYGVSSIPYTVLLDKEGKILAKNLRGPMLEAKLSELLD